MTSDIVSTPIRVLCEGDFVDDYDSKRYLRPGFLVEKGWPLVKIEFFGNPDGMIVPLVQVRARIIEVIDSNISENDSESSPEPKLYVPLGYFSILIEVEDVFSSPTNGSGFSSSLHHVRQSFKARP